VLGLNATEEATLIEVMPFSSDRLTVLQETCSFVLDARINNATILAAFTFSSDKATALEIIENCAPRSCVYGEITVKKVHFVVDTSGSMAGSFPINGQSITRLKFAQHQLHEVIMEQLPQMEGPCPSPLSSTHFLNNLRTHLHRALVHPFAVHSHVTSRVCIHTAMS
jgi:hypothetical protein